MNARASWTQGRDCARAAPAATSDHAPLQSGRFESSFWVIRDGPGKNYKNTHLLLVREGGTAGFVWARLGFFLVPPSLARTSDLRRRTPSALLVHRGAIAAAK